MSFTSILKKTAAAGVVALAVAAPAKADWGGLYIGASVGWVGLTDTNWTFNGGNTVNIGEVDNFIAGGHIGFQHQWGQIVVGVEASYSGTLASRDNASAPCPNPAFTCTLTARQVFTLGPRLGWAPNNQFLVYVTGGYAAAWLDTNAISVPLEEKTSARHEGWYIGGGLEWALHHNWILGVEYQHLFLDSELHTSPLFAPGDNRVIEADADIVRVRLSYKWGRPEAAPLK